MRRLPPVILGALLIGGPVRPADQPLHVLIRSEYLDPDVVKDFEGRFDARLTADVFEEAKSLLAKKAMDRLEFLRDLGARTRLHDQVWTQVKTR